MEKVNLAGLQQLTSERDDMYRRWVSAIKALAPDHSTRTIARCAGVSHGTVYQITKGVTR